MSVRLLTKSASGLRRVAQARLDRRRDGEHGALERIEDAEAARDDEEHAGGDDEAEPRTGADAHGGAFRSFGTAAAHRTRAPA